MDETRARNLRKPHCGNRLSYLQCYETFQKIGAPKENLTDGQLYRDTNGALMFLRVGSELIESLNFLPYSLSLSDKCVQAM